MSDKGISPRSSKSHRTHKIKTGKFTREESERIFRAVDRYIAEHFACPREVALKAMISRRGNTPSMLTLLAKEVLPHRSPRSIYNFVRRHMMGHKLGRWSDSELFILLKAYFENDDVEVHCWRSASEQINRSPEQIHDKFRELKPYIHNYKHLVVNSRLTDEEKLVKLAHVTKRIREKVKKDKKKKEFMNSQMQQEFYDTIREIMSKNENQDQVENIPWAKVQEKFSNYPASKLRIHFNMTLLPKVYRTVYPGFGVGMVSRLSIRWIRKIIKRSHTKRIQSLNDLNFRVKFPQIPVIYMKHCTKRSLIKLVRKYANQVMKPQKCLLDAVTQKEINELKKIADESLRGFFTNNYVHRIIKFAYKHMEIKKWKREDRHILKMIQKDILPECKL